jgi:hypothetical protein
LQTIRALAGTLKFAQHNPCYGHSRSMNLD